MPSPEASRRNARRSTGPRTPEGKAAARLNSLTHGAFAKDLLLPGEDPAALRELEHNFRRHYRPANAQEEFFLDRMILAAWRLHRLAAMECRVLRSQAASTSVTARLFDSLHSRLGLPAEPSPPGASAADDDPVADAWVHDANTGNVLVKLCRSQTCQERSFYRAFNQFRRLRAVGDGDTSS
jgi:hypothetical protein